MTAEMREALFGMYDALELAAKSQVLRGAIDQGARSKVTSGNHMLEVLSVMLDDLEKGGFSPNDLLYKRGEVALPGYFRASKQWDLLCFDGSDLMAAIEFKSISSSFGNNQNNRVEEAIGSAVDLQQSGEAGLLPWAVRPPARCYVMIVCDCADSRSVVRNPLTHFDIDPIFAGTTYLDRFEILCRRLLDRHLYEAIWLAYVDPVKRTIIEPTGLTYELFIEMVVHQLKINRMH